MAPLGEGEARLLTPDTLNSLDSAPAWSPDGTKIAFISDRNGWNNLGVIDVGTGQTRMLLTEEIEHSEPRWSPDGEWISFTKNLDYQYHIFKIPAEGGEAMQLTQRGGSTAARPPQARPVECTSGIPMESRSFTTIPIPP